MKQTLMTAATTLMLVIWAATAAAYDIRGRVIDKMSRAPIAYANVSVVGLPTVGATTADDGTFTITGLKPGFYSLTASFVGYKTAVTSDYQVAQTAPFVEIELEEDSEMLDGVTVTSSVFRRLPNAPNSLRLISLQEIEKSPGGNRDISRIVRSYPGVSYSPAGYRNDLIVRGGSPSENRFFMDGIEIPNINHFSTQGASGGPVGIINADFLREVKFYTGSFPADKGNALSSILDFSLKDGNMTSNTYKATLGASEVSLTGDGHIGERVSYLVSVRQSYLQLLFKMLGLPFLPKYTDGQLKLKVKIDRHNELTILGLFGIDDMQLNTSITGGNAEYLLSYLPTIKQETFTVGAAYKHYGGRHVQTLSLGHSWLKNRNFKYRNNDESSEDNLTLRIGSIEQKTSLRFDNKAYLGRWTWAVGANVAYASYTDESFRRIFTDRTMTSTYSTDLGLVMWGIYTTASYTSADDRFSTSFGFRSDGTDFSHKTSQMWRNISPRASVTYSPSRHVDISASAGYYSLLPAYTALGYKDNDGHYANAGLDYMHVMQGTLGVNWNVRPNASLSVEAFYKGYTDIPLSVSDNIPLLCKGNDYGVVGNEALISSASGRSYGVELMGKWQVPGKVSLVSSLTIYKSEYRNDRHSPYIASAWDNRFVWNTSCTYELPHSWSIGARLSCLGGAPYTPYDADKSSLIEAWDATGRPYLDYSRYNDERLPAYYQLDVRVDKVFFFPRVRFGVYVDLQNVTVSQYRQPDALMSTGIIDPADPRRYVMKSVDQDSGSLIPTIGLSVEF